MIALAIAIILALSFVGLAYVARKHPLEALRRGIQVVACLMAVTSLVAGLLLFPSSRAWQSSRSVAVQEAQADAEVDRATRMIEVLGSPAAYIEYLKAIKAD